MIRRHMAFVVSLVLTLSGGVAAQETGKPAVAAAEKVRADLKADVRQLLMSKKVVEQAWGAYYAGKYGLTDLAPLLWGLIDPANKNYRDPQQRCIRNALIQLEATADAEKFELLIEKHWNLCALRAAISGESAEQLMILLRTSRDAKFQVATCNKLVDLKHSEVSKELLSRITLDVDIGV